MVSTVCLRPLLLACAFTALAAGPVSAGNEDPTRVYRDKATAAFALGHYAAAAEHFEKAFELSPEPALLYNAAQAHRLAGNKERALTLYQNYSRTYGVKEKRAEVDAHIAELTRAIDQDKAVATSPPVTTEPVGGSADRTGPRAPVEVREVPRVAAAPAAPVLVTQPAETATDDRPLVRKPWFWATVAGGVAIVTTLVLVLALSGSTDPSGSIGMVDGN